MRTVQVDDYVGAAGRIAVDPDRPRLLVNPAADIEDPRWGML